MKRALPFVAWLTIVWIALWEDVSVANVLSGVAASSALLLLFRRHVPPGAGGRIRPVAAARFLVYFVWKLVEASAIVAWEVVTPRNRITEGIVAIPVRGVSDTVTTLVANAISLTPGTLTLDVSRDPTVLYVHVLHLDDIEAVRRDVLQLEALAIAAFGSSAAAAAAAAAARSPEAAEPAQATRQASKTPDLQEGTKP